MSELDDRLQKWGGIVTVARQKQSRVIGLVRTHLRLFEISYRMTETTKYSLPKRSHSRGALMAFNHCRLNPFETTSLLIRVQ